MDLVEEGFVKEEEAWRMVIPTFGRSRQEFMAPFALNGSFSSLAMEEIEVFSGQDHIRAEFQNNGDALAFGTRWAAFSRVSVGRRSPRAWTLEKGVLPNSFVAWRLAWLRGYPLRRSQR